MRVVDYDKWQRTKCVCALILLITAIACAGGLEDQTGTTAMPSPVGFITCITLLVPLTLSLYKGDKR